MDSLPWSSGFVPLTGRPMLAIKQQQAGVGPRLGARHKLEEQPEEEGLYVCDLPA